MSKSEEKELEQQPTSVVAEAMNACKKALPSADEMRAAKWVELASKLATIHDVFVAQIRDGGKAMLWISTLKYDKIVDGNGFINIQSNYPASTATDIEQLLTDLDYKVIKETSSSGSCNLEIRL
jgi:hypothetical protein